MLSFQVHEVFMPANVNPLLRPGTAERKKERRKKQSSFPCFGVSLLSAEGGEGCCAPSPLLPCLSAKPGDVCWRTGDLGPGGHEEPGTYR